MSKKLVISLLVLLVLPSFLFAKSKQKQPQLIQFSGVVLSNDSLHPLPFVSIMVKNTYRGTMSDYYGYFSFVAQANDTIEFSSTGYKSAYFVIPDTLKSDRYSIIQTLTGDTVNLKAVKIYPWPTRAEFKEAFLHAQIPSNDLTRAKSNLSQEAMANKIRYYSQLPDPNLDYRYSMETYQTRLYQAGQVPTTQLFNPLAWAQFIRAWRNGDLKIER